MRIFDFIKIYAEGEIKVETPFIDFKLHGKKEPNNMPKFNLKADVLGNEVINVGDPNLKQAFIQY